MYSHTHTHTYFVSCFASTIYLATAEMNSWFKWHSRKYDWGISCVIPSRFLNTSGLQTPIQTCVFLGQIPYLLSIMSVKMLT